MRLQTTVTLVDDVPDDFDTSKLQSEVKQDMAAWIAEEECVLAIHAVVKNLDTGEVYGWCEVSRRTSADY